VQWTIGSVCVWIWKIIFLWSSSAAVAIGFTVLSDTFMIIEQVRELRWKLGICARVWQLSRCLGTNASKKMLSLTNFHRYCPYCKVFFSLFFLVRLVLAVGIVAKFHKIRRPILVNFHRPSRLTSWTLMHPSQVSEVSKHFILLSSRCCLYWFHTWKGPRHFSDVIWSRYLVLRRFHVLCHWMQPAEPAWHRSLGNSSLMLWGGSA